MEEKNGIISLACVSGKIVEKNELIVNSWRIIKPQFSYSLHATAGV